MYENLSFMTMFIHIKIPTFEDVHMLHANVLPFYINGLSICEFWGAGNNASWVLRYDCIR